MNITWGFINTSQQSPKIMKARCSSSQQLPELLLRLCLFSSCMTAEEAFDHSSAGFSSLLRDRGSAKKQQKTAEAPLICNTNELC